jgi:hypothetical protein
MRVRSWMAALTLIGASSILIGRGLSAQGSGRAQEASSPKEGEAKEPSEKSAAESPRGEPPKPGSQPEKRRDSAPNLPTIRLKLAIAGLGAEGCVVEVKPANPSCRFRPSPSTHVASDGHAMIELHDIELRGADKTCTMAITVLEPGRPPQTIYRGFRTASAKPGSAPPSFTCFINSRLAGVETHSTRK